MAKKASRRKRRTPEQMIKDLEAEIARVNMRAAKRELQRSPAVKKVLQAAKTLSKAAELAREEGDTQLVHAVVDAREALGVVLEDRGMKLDVIGRPRGRRAGSAAS